MVHEGESLEFGLEVGHHLTRIHAHLDQLECHPALYRLLLFGQPHLAHAAFANQLQKLIGADHDRNERNAARCLVGGDAASVRFSDGLDVMRTNIPVCASVAARQSNGNEVGYGQKNGECVSWLCVRKVLSGLGHRPY